VAPDTIRPTAPSRVAVAASGDPGTLTVSWSASTDNVAMGRYRVFLSPAPGSGAAGPPSGVVTGTRWTSGLLAPGAWTATVVAIDRSGLTSAPSASVTAVLGLPDAAQNMLTANQASIESSTAGFDPASGTTGTLQLARDTSVALDGASSLRLTALTSGSISARSSRNWSPAAPGSAYSASIAVHAGAGTPAGRQAHVQMRFYDAAQGVSPQVVNSSSIAVPTSGWTRLSLSGVVAPSSAAYVTVGLVVDAPNAGESYLTDAWGLWRSAALPAWALPPVRTARPLVAILGDSYESGLGTTRESARWSSLVATRNGWLEANLGRGGTGFVTTAGSGGCGLPVCPTITDMASAAVAAKPDIVLVSGGRNDGAATPAVQAAIETTIAALRAGLPNARIVVISPMWDSSTPGPALASMEAWEAASAGAHAAQLVPGAASWLTGHPEWIADGVHPNDQGYAQIATRVLDALG
jgi:lysophospholipase L1-like esterase